jgi:cysteine desulfuration protein SufE
MNPIQDRKDKLLQELKAQPTPDDRFRYLIKKAGELEILTEAEKIDKFLVKGCISRAWLVPSFDGARVYFKADSEASIVKGVIAALVQVYSGGTPDEILSLSPEFLAEGGVSDALSMNRRNGLANMLKQVRLYAFAYQSLIPKDSH